MLVFLPSLLVLSTLASCSRGPDSKPASSSQSTTHLRTFAVKGVLKKLEAGSRTVTIQHEEVPNFMPAMTMPFTVKDTKELQGLAPGDAISFQLHVTADESWIDQLQKTARPSTNAAPVRPPVRLVRDVEPLKVGDTMPDYRFTNELGQAVSLSDFKGKALALTFIFTRCPVPEFCPLMSRHFAAAQKQLAAMPNAPTNWHLLSISFDPHFDTPRVLRAYAQMYRPDASHWSFVTGALIDIDAITEQFDLPIVKQGENWEHKLRTVVIDAAGRIQTIFPGNQWTAEELVAEIVKAATAPQG
ncbi:MAG: SCO family protein [Verrucomicrobia bacterium]|nr:SCO family protein [Verrucomicrobiota bacterium]